MIKQYIEAWKFCVNAELSFQFSGEEDKYKYIYAYYKAKMQTDLSPQARTRLHDDLSFTNFRAFAKAYKQHLKHLKECMAVRYISSTMPADERIEALQLKFSKYQLVYFGTKQGVEEATSKMAPRGAVNVEPKGVGADGQYQYAITYKLFSPAIFHQLKEAAENLGLHGGYEDFEKAKVKTVIVKADDSDEEQIEMITLGKKEAKVIYPDVDFESADGDSSNTA